MADGESRAGVAMHPADGKEIRHERDIHTLTPPRAHTHEELTGFFEAAGKPGAVRGLLGCSSQVCRLPWLGRDTRHVASSETVQIGRAACRERV